MSNESFRREVRDWLAENCPESARGPGETVTIGSKRPMANSELLEWRHRLGERGWTIPTWPKSYGGGGLTADEARVLAEEMRAIKARAPMGGMGTSMLGPTLLEYGTEEQKLRHIPKIAMGDVSWCQGYSEPGAGSDLAGLQTRAVDKGDFFEVNGQKIWTSGANFADWIFVLVRTDPEAPKHDGISFVLMDMHQPGITVKPIQLISGSSPFCETFFDNAVVEKENLVGQLNRGWTVGKRLLQFERSGQGGVGPAAARAPKPSRSAPASPLLDVARKYVGTDTSGAISDHESRDTVIQFGMNQRSFALTQRRAREENTSGKTMGEAASIFKYYGATMARDTADHRVRMMGAQGYGWEGDTFSEAERGATRAWLHSRAVTIYGGTNEVQLNIISKRVLGLPD
jgi:alkylation response protein AidB-like acyl-CoA dehydrogenase